MNIELIEINKLKPATYNPRQISTKQYNDLKKSIQKFDLVDPIIVNKDMTVIGGHQRLKICKELKYKDVDCVVLDLNKEQERELNVRLNKSGGEFDMDILANEFDIDELVDWGFKHIDLDINIDKITEGNTEDDHIPEVKESRVKLGEVWQLGKHRLMCGDSTKESDVNKLMNGEKADMVFTDPPYGIGYEYNSHKDKKGKEYLDFCDRWFNVLLMFSDLIIITTGWTYKFFWWGKNPSDEMVWFDKTKQSGGRSYFLRKTEPIFIFGKIKEKYTWDIFENQSNRGDGIRELHTCPKPISLIIDIIKPQTKTNDLILDVFLGSGTTLIACEKTNRVCYGMELDTKYCDVIIERWEQFTGQKATKL